MMYDECEMKRKKIMMITFMMSVIVKNSSNPLDTYLAAESEIIAEHK